MQKDDEDSWHEEILGDPEASEAIQLRAVRSAIREGLSVDEAFALYGDTIAHLRQQIEAEQRR